MILAHMAAQYPEELTCDMAETYHVLDWRALGLPLAATLAAGLRENSRTRMALAGAKVPTETLLLGQAADAGSGRWHRSASSRRERHTNHHHIEDVFLTVLKVHYLLCQTSWYRHKESPGSCSVVPGLFSLVSQLFACSAAF